MAIVTRVGKGSKLTAKEMDDNLLSLESDISGNVSAITSKLDKGSYTGTAQDLKALIDTKGIVGPTGATGAASTVAGPTGATGATGAESTVAGPTGATGSGLKVTTWSAGAYALGDQVNYLGKDWTANAATVAGDVPGTSTKWTERLSGYATSFLSNNFFLLANATYGAYIQGSQGTRYINNSGSSWSVSGFIEISSGEQLNFYNNLALKTCKYIVYNSSRVKIEDGEGSSFIASTTAKFFKIDLGSGTNINTFQILKGTIAPTKYTKPTYSLDKKDGRELLVDVANLSENVLTTALYDVDKISLSLTENVFILNNATYGAYVQGSQGARLIQNGSTWYVSDFIEISSGEQLNFYNNIALKNSKYIVYNSSRVKIEDGEGSSFIASTNANFVRVDMGSGINYNLSMILKGTIAPTKYIKSTYSLNKKDGRELSLDVANLSEPVVTNSYLDTTKINFKQASFLVDSINLVDNLAVTLNAALYTNGIVYTAPGWGLTDFIPITENVKNYSFTNSNIITFDANKVVNNITITSGQPIPSTVKFIRFFAGNGGITSFDVLYSLNWFFGIADSVPLISFAKALDPMQVDVIDAKRILSFPNTAKKVFCVGDSFTMHGRYFSKLCETAFLQKVGDTGGSGNGMTITGFANMINTSFSTQVANADIITILGGTNDYNHGSTRIGSYEDVAGTNTIYGAVKAIVDTILAIKPSARIVFFTQPERGSYNGSPTNTIPPAVNQNGLNMWNISEAIYDCCNRLGVACYQTHHTLWHFSQVNMYTEDKLHPNKEGGIMLGRQMGAFINRI
jgi:hypothetical protein